MDYNEFKNKLLQHVKSRLENAEIRNYTKNNSIEKEGIYIREDGKNCNPLIHLDDLYGLYKLTGDIEGVAEFVLEISGTSRNIDVQTTLGSWEKVQSRLTIRLINSAWNQKFLQGVPHRDLMDLSLVVYMDFVKNAEGVVSMAVTSGLLEIWEIDEETLFQTALNNLQKEKFIIRDMEEVIQELRGEQRKPTPYDGLNYVMTNTERQFGARGMLRTDLITQFAETVNADLYILPNSINDIILTPAIKELTDEDLNDMMTVIKVFNKPDQDSLSDNIYYFSRESGAISIYTPETETAVL